VEFEGRLGVPVGADLAAARAAMEAAVAAALDDGEAPAQIAWDGGAFAPAETPLDHPFVGLVQRAFADELSRPVALAGAPYGADMRHFTARGIPCVMAGTGGLERAHAVDEWVDLAELAAVARAMIRAVIRSSGAPA
jgi:acetylornithine deacetylase